jgi:alkyl hydroperoxide reductase subunit F
MLDSNLKTQLQGYLARISQPVEIVASLDDGEKSREMLELLNDIESASSLVQIDSQRDDAQVKPSFALRQPGAEARVRFAGVPMGHEFTSLVLALLQTGGYPPKIDESVVEQIKNLDGDYHFETFVSLTCQSCPDVVQALNAMAALNPKIRHTMIDGAVFQDEVARREVMAVPAVFLNGEPFGQGRMELAEIIHKLDSGAAKRETEKLNARAPYDVLVVGGGPAGAAAAIYAARKGIRTGIAAERLGGQLLDTVGIENFISVKETHGHKLASGLEQHVMTYDVDVMNLQRAEALVPGDLIEVKLSGGASLKARSVVIATGARWREIKNQRARRARIPQSRRRLLPALRRPAIQGQAGGGDRRREFRRRSGHRSCGAGEPCHPD